MSVHPWHHVSLGQKAPEIVSGIIEIPKGSKNKYEIDKNSGMLFLDRVMSSPVFYPIHYGFIPQTYCDDGDALDIMVLTQEDVPPLTLMNCRVIGALNMIDGGEADDKILAVHADDPYYKHICEIEDLEKTNPHILKEIAQFFKVYKLLEAKKVEVAGWVGREKAYQILKDSIALYEKDREKLMKPC